MFKNCINPPGDWMLSSAKANTDELSNLSDATKDRHFPVFHTNSVKLAKKGDVARPVVLPPALPNI